MSARVLKSIYYPNSNILEAELGSHPSQVWRTIVQSRDTLKQGLIKRIGNGAATDIWSQNWLPREGMFRPYGSIVPNPPTKVSDLINNTTASWNIQLLQATFIQ